jgi:CheY-like chemotaxis protein
LRLRQILINLTYNAVKFTDQGSVVLRVSEREALPKARLIRFVVEDTGVGISQEALTRLFQPFYQVDSSTTRRFGGTGLGLTITKQLVGLMGGVISVESKEGLGSRFTVDIPFSTREKRAIEAASGAREREARPCDEDSEYSSFASMARVKVSASNRSRNGRILLVEDNETNRLVAGDMLEMDGYEVTYACNGREAVELVLGRRVPFDLILMDVQMPVLDGLGASRLIREEMPTVPIVAMTAHAMQSERKRCTDAGMSDHLSKPFEPDELRQMIDRWLYPPKPSSLNQASDG